MTEIEIIEALAVEEARVSFYAYRQYINPKLKLGWWQRMIARELQAFFEDLIAGKRPKLIIQAPPQHGKSLIIIDFISWLAGKYPDCRTIYTSFSERLGVRANLRLQRMYDGEKYKKVFPDTMINSSNSVSISAQNLRNREIIEYCGHDGFFRNTTVCGSITGEGLDLGVIDDPIKGREQARSITIRDKTWDWLTDDFFTRFSEEAGLLVILTRWHVDDPIGRLQAANPEIKVISHPAIAIEDEEFRKAGEALFPQHKSLEFLNAVKGIMAPSSWESLYQQRPFIEDGEFFKPDKISIVDALPAGISYVRGWDLAATEGGGDWTAGPKLGKLDDGRIIIADVVRVQRGPDGVREVLKNTADLDGTRVKIRIPQDPAQAGKAQVQSLVRLLAGYNVIAKPVSGDKSLRAEPFAAQVNVGNVVMLRAPWNEKLLTEMRMFPNGPNDDQIDGMSDAYDELVGGGGGPEALMEHMRRVYEAKMKAEQNAN